MTDALAITGNTLVEDLIQATPGAISYLLGKGIVCVQCGEPVWGTLEEVVRAKGFSDEDIARIVTDLNQLASEHDRDK